MAWSGATACIARPISCCMDICCDEPGIDMAMTACGDIMLNKLNTNNRLMPARKDRVLRQGIPHPIEFFADLHAQLGNLVAIHQPQHRRGIHEGHGVAAVLFLPHHHVAGQ